MTDEEQSTLTRTERWILANQYRILEHLDPDNPTYKRSRQALEHGFELEYPFAQSHIREDTLSAGGCEEVLDIINMYIALANALEDSTIAPEDVTFPGFSKYEELPQLLYFAYRRDHNLTGGMLSYDHNLDRKEPQLPKYRWMLQAWKASANPDELTPQGAERIIKAPENRLRLQQ